MPIVLSENFRALFYAPFYASYATGGFARAGVEVEFRTSSDPLAAAAALRAGEVGGHRSAVRYERAAVSQKVHQNGQEQKADGQMNQKRMEIAHLNPG